MNLSQLVYTSRRTPALTRDALDAVVRHSAATNKARDISGMLLCHGRNVLQLLEGDNAAIHALFQRIRTDARHADVKLLLSKAVNRRLFPEWGMGMADLSNKCAVSTDRLTRLLDDVRAAKETVGLTLEARLLLADFRQQVATAA